MKYVSMLRGINVSGQKKIRMAELKSLYAHLGFDNVVTYIQSGNVIFDAGRRNSAEIADTLERAIEKKFKFSVPIILRTHKELDRIISHCPFKGIDLEKEGNSVLVTFSNTKPGNGSYQKITDFIVPPEELNISGSEIYLYCPHGYGKSKLSNAFLEKKLGIVATTRNMKSIIKLHALSSAKPSI